MHPDKRARFNALPHAVRTPVQRAAATYSMTVDALVASVLGSPASDPSLATYLPQTLRDAVIAGLRGGGAWVTPCPGCGHSTETPKPCLTCPRLTCPSCRDDAGQCSACGAEHAAKLAAAATATAEREAEERRRALAGARAAGPTTGE